MLTNSATTYQPTEHTKTVNKSCLSTIIWLTVVCASSYGTICGWIKRDNLREWVNFAVLWVGDALIYILYVKKWYILNPLAQLLDGHREQHLVSGRPRGGRDGDQPGLRHQRHQGHQEEEGPPGRRRRHRGEGRLFEVSHLLTLRFNLPNHLF